MAEENIPTSIALPTPAAVALSVATVGLWAAMMRSLRRGINRPLHTFSNLIAALREGDYSIGARSPGEGDAMSEVTAELNSLVAMLREERLGALEATALLQTVMVEIDVSIFTFDGDRKLRLARLPEPRLAEVDLGELIRRVAELETRAPVVVRAGQPVSLSADGDQLEKAMINLVRNAMDAALEASPEAPVVEIGWSLLAGRVELWVSDNGLGLANTANLFVPFFTTKPQGNGIGLALCRQIAEAHGGSLTLVNRVGTCGCVARLRLPRQG